VSIGGGLEQARRAAGLTVAQVSQQTKIPETVIRGIERDDYSVCGAGFWTRGHIRSIARAVGADPEPLIRGYDAAQLAGQRAAADDEVTLPDLPAVGQRSPVPSYPEAARTAVGHLVGGPDPSEPAPPGLRSGQGAGRAAAGRPVEARAAAGDVAGSAPASGHPSAPPGLLPAAEPGEAADYPAGLVRVGRRAAPGVPEPVSPPVPGSRRWLTRAAMLALALAATLAVVAFFVRSPHARPRAGQQRRAAWPRATRRDTGRTRRQRLARPRPGAPPGSGP
jgi:hypothetical protein